MGKILKVIDKQILTVTAGVITGLCIGFSIPYLIALKYSGADLCLNRDVPWIIRSMCGELSDLAIIFIVSPIYGVFFGFIGGVYYKLKLVRFILYATSILCPIGLVVLMQSVP